MEASEITAIREAGEEIESGIKIDTHRLDLIESDGVNLQCVNSSDFMVGKQTNFNGPVTIINYAEGSEPENFFDRHAKTEEVIIKEKIIAPSVTATMENFVKEKAEKEMSKLTILASNKQKKLTVKGICLKNFYKVPVFVWSLLAFLVLAGLIVLIIEFVLTDDVRPLDAEIILGNSTNHTLYKRSHWGAERERSSVAIKLPVKYVVVSSSGGDACNTLRDCKKILRSTQKVQKRKSLADIYANFFASSDGSLFEGRGWEKRNAYLGFANSRSIEINCLGDFNSREYPTEPQIDAIAALIRYGVQQNRVDSNYYLVASNATGLTLPKDSTNMGRNLYEKIKLLPRFEPNPNTRIYYESTNFCLVEGNLGGFE